MAATLLLLDYHHPHQHNHADHLLMSSSDGFIKPNVVPASAHLNSPSIQLPSPNHSDNLHINHHDRHLNRHVRLIQQHPQHHTLQLNSSLATDHSDHNQFVGDSKDVIQLRAFDPHQPQQPTLQHAEQPPMARCIALDEVLTGLEDTTQAPSSIAINHAPESNDQGLKEQMDSKFEGAHAPLFTDKGQEVELRGRRASSSTNPLKVSRSRKSSRVRATMRRSGILVMKNMASTSSQFQTTSVARDLYTAFALILVVGITTLAQKTSLLANSPRTLCPRCNGFGVEPCHICRGNGFVSWEGKFKRFDPCPLCFGSCTKKCSTCGGGRVRKGVPPFLQQLAEVRARKSKP